jgi:hypothetical protein
MGMRGESMNDFLGSFNFTFNSDVDKKDISIERQEWANALFGNPLVFPLQLQPNIINGELATYEPSLYSDWQTRDTELGYNLLSPRVQPLSQAIDCFRSGIMQRQRLIALKRTQMEALIKINQNEHNPALRHPAALIEELQHEVLNATREYDFLRSFSAPIELSADVINSLLSLGGSGQYRPVEQIYRLLGLAWKGQLKIQAFRQRFANVQYDLKVNSRHSPHFFLAGARNVAGIEITLDEQVVFYILHCLETIQELTHHLDGLFEPETRQRYLQEQWSPPLVLVRAIVELFHFCQFEMPYRHANIHVDTLDADRLWTYRADSGQWQSHKEEAAGDRLKRQIAELIRLLIAPPAFLNCRDPQELSAYCQSRPVRTKSTLLEQYHPYRSIGLARLEIEPRGQFYKFQSGYELAAQLLEQIINIYPPLLKAFTSKVGGPLLTLRAMARLDGSAFVGDYPDLNDSERYALLSKFWQLLSRQRPLALLGQDYAKAVHNGITALGEMPPERSSLLSVQLSTIFRQNIWKKEDPIIDPIMTLVIADQFRLIDLINASWALVAEYFKLVINNSDESMLRQVLATMTIAADQEELVAQRFNDRWINATQPIWSLIRSSAPVVWDLWISLRKRIPLVNTLGSYDLESALGYIFRIAGDTARLILILEGINPTLAERLSIHAEAASRELLTTFFPYIHSLGLMTNFNCYFDLECRHDSWLAFVTSYRTYLLQISQKLEKAGENEEYIAVIRNTIDRLQEQYPSVAANGEEAMSVAAPPSPNTGHLALDPLVIDEELSITLETICQKLLGNEAFTPDRLLQLLGLLRNNAINQDLVDLAKWAELLHGALSANYLRTAVLITPRVVKETVAFLRKALQHSPQLSDRATVELVSYLDKVNTFSRQVQGTLDMSVWDAHNIREPYKRLTGNQLKVNNTEFVLYSVMGQVFIKIGVVGTAKEIVRGLELEVLAYTQTRFPNWQPEVLLLGGGRIQIAQEELVLSGNSEFNPSFTAPQQPVSAKLLWYALKVRYETVVRLLSTVLPTSQFTIVV